MTDVAEPRRDDGDEPIITGVEDVTELDESDLGDGVPEEEDADIYTQTVKAPGLGSES